MKTYMVHNTYSSHEIKAETVEAALEEAKRRFFPKGCIHAEEILTCDECGDSKTATQFCDPSASQPKCKACAEAFWEMMGDDPCGKDWNS